MIIKERRKKIKVLDLMVLYYHFYRFIEKHGHLDATKTIVEIEDAAKFTVGVPVSTLERLIYSCNLLNEEKEFKHPKGDEFDYFLKRVKQNEEYDKVYNYFKGPVPTEDEPAK